MAENRKEHALSIFKKAHWSAYRSFILLFFSQSLCAHTIITQQNWWCTTTGMKEFQRVYLSFFFLLFVYILEISTSRCCVYNGRFERNRTCDFQRQCTAYVFRMDLEEWEFSAAISDIVIVCYVTGVISRGMTVRVYVYVCVCVSSSIRKRKRKNVFNLKFLKIVYFRTVAKVCIFKRHFDSDQLGLSVWHLFL